MSDEHKVAEVVRISAVFAKGCANTIAEDPPLPPEACEECRTDFLQRIANVMAGLPHDTGLTVAAD